jgi:Co/Zn/Cd efflux system component
LIVNISAALALMRFREGGDANARAIWLFSRNDALANIAVIIAAGLVAWLKAAWPDLVVAAVIALLFLHSAWETLVARSLNCAKGGPHKARNPAAVSSSGARNHRMMSAALTASRCA